MSRKALARKTKPIGAEDEALNLARAKWRSSDLTDEQAARLHLTPLTGEETAGLGAFHPVRALKMPYFDLDGKLTGFFRIRYLEQLPGFAGLIKKPQRYAQPKGTLNEVYLPPVTKLPWFEIAKDPSITIHITEGELKAACACVHGLVTAGLGGVDVWRSTKREIDFLPVLHKINWEGRQVVIIYDSDAAINPNVVRAQRQLAGMLVAKGAYPTIASLPPTPAGAKQGLDDFILAKGTKALQKIIDDAEGFPEADALWTLNEEIAYIKDPGIIVVKENGQKIDPGRFIAHAYANRHFMQTDINKDGKPIFKKKKLAPRWIEWESRHEMAGLTYAPGEGQITKEGKWNTWPGWGCNPVKGDIDPWLWLLDFIFNKQPEEREWFERWCAYPIQHPGAKLYTASVIWGLAHGTGKSFIAYALMGIYGDNAIQIGNKDMHSGFNAWQANKQLVYGDEIAGTDMNAKRIDADWLKTVITQPIVKINEKYMPVIVVPDLTNYIFNSNKQNTCFLEDGDRRYFVHEVFGRPAARDYYDRVDKWLGLRRGFYHGPGREHLFHHLLHLDLKNFSPVEHAPMTAAKEAMIMTSRTDAGLWCVALKEDPERVLAGLGREPAKRCDLFTATQLLKMYDPEQRTKLGPAGLARELTMIGFRQANRGQPVRTSAGVLRLWMIRNINIWSSATSAQLNIHYSKFFGADQSKVQALPKKEVP